MINVIKLLFDITNHRELIFFMRIYCRHFGGLFRDFVLCFLMNFIVLLWYGMSTWFSKNFVVRIFKELLISTLPNSSIPLKITFQFSFESNKSLIINNPPRTKLHNLSCLKKIQMNKKGKITTFFLNRTWKLDVIHLRTMKKKTFCLLTC